METLELVIYTAIALIVGGILVSVTIDLSKVKEQENPESIRYSKEEFLQRLPVIWKDCGLGSYDKAHTLYIHGSEPLSKEDVVLFLTKYNHDLPAKDLNMPTLNIPSIVLVQCTRGQLNITEQ